MRILVTTSRMPFALEMVRRFGDAGHTVFASDTFRTAPGSHSRHVARAFVTESPRFAPVEFVRDVIRILASERVELLVPSFEESFCLSASLDALQAHARVFTAPLDVLRRLHDKAALVGLAGELGIAVPPSAVVSDAAGLRAAVSGRSGWFARPAYSRGGVDLLTDTGPLAGAVELDACQPTADNPWLVQDFVHGEDVCTFSTAHDGRLTSHMAYVHPRTIEHAGGIAFESVDAPETLAVTQRLVGALRYTGQIGLDFLRSGRGLFLVECNPRATSGLALMPTEMYVGGVLDPARPLEVLGPGHRLKITTALLRDMVLNWREAPADLEAILDGGDDLYTRADDPLPGLYQLLSYTQVLAYRWKVPRPQRHRSDLVAAQFHDVEWNGDAFGAVSGRT